MKTLLSSEIHLVKGERPSAVKKTLRINGASGSIFA